MAFNPQSLTDLLSPALWSMRARAPESVVDAKLYSEMDLVSDTRVVRLLVDHELLRLRRDERVTNDVNHHLFKERLKKALLVKDPEAKSIAINRRRMLWRGAEAKKAKPKVKHGHHLRRSW